MTNLDDLPSTTIGADGPASTRARSHGLDTFQAAARYVHAVPYGRTSDRGDYLAILDEERGTCSTKHAFLAALAAENVVDADLVLGIYLMTGENTPGIATVIDSSSLGQIPEAHCYLCYGDAQYDLTMPGLGPSLEYAMQSERRIDPPDIADVKPRFHRAFVDDWAADRGHDPDYVWDVREACIEALSSDS